MSSRATTGARHRRGAALTCAALVLALAGCEAEGGPPPASQPPASSPTGDPVRLTLGVQGAPDELAAYEAVAANFDSLYDPATVQVRNYDNSAQMLRSVEDGEDLPDVFLVSRDDLATLQDQQLTQPVDVLLDERGVDFGDGYSRDALQAFSAEDRLQCMPYGISPMVIFYNTELVDFDRMEARGLLFPAEREAWTLEMFAAAAQFVSRPGPGAHGFYIEPGLRTLAPFVYSGGGQLFDDDDAPTSLALSEGDSVEAMERTLE
ncbi:MAG TPA: extracellular solute-binding protein, partial [Nocardioides sp.]|nr:extracellular solute-binding protein [Nocardioides sp.]